MMAQDENSTATGTSTAAALVSDQRARRIELPQSGTQFSPEPPFVWGMGLLAAAACVAPWLHRGWMFFTVAAVVLALLACYDGRALWLTRREATPVLMLPAKGLRGQEGQTILVPLVFTSVPRRRARLELRVGLMPSTPESEIAIHVTQAPQSLVLEQAAAEEEASVPEHAATIQQWPWLPELGLLRRGSWPAPRVGIERRSPLRCWRLRRWFDLPEPLRIEANLRIGRREILRSPVYRALVASQQTPWTGHGREFERLREYTPGDNYSEIAWKSTARRGAPVTRLFQWEQKQEIYFIVDQSRASALALDNQPGDEDEVAQQRAPRRLLDLAVETALVGATVALELGDDFGLVTFADEPTSWLRAGSGQFQFRQFQQRLLEIEPLPTTADYEALFAEIQTRLRRRAYLLLLADLTERSVADSLRRGVGLVRSSHALLMTSILPKHASPAFSPREELHTDQDVYATLAGEKESQRLGALARQMSQFDVQLRYIPAEMFLRTAVEGYLESKREQRL